jgi:hypothetical protein
MDTLWFVLWSSEFKCRVVWEVFTNVLDKTWCSCLHNKVHGIVTGRSEISTADKTSNRTHCFISSLFFQELLFIFICSLFSDILINTELSVPNESFWL